jgi:4-hydroxythreonine-4-phosphate dehydrogenase
VTGPILAITMGDPAGIGPEIIVKAWQAAREGGQPFFAVGDHDLLAGAPGAGGLKLERIASPEAAAQVFPRALPVLDLPVQGQVVAGKPSPAHAPAVIRWIETASGLALSGAIGGLVTAPISKAPLYEAGFSFPGHTEFLGELTRGHGPADLRGPVMMLAAQDLRTTLVTIHEPLGKVPGLLTIDRIVSTVRITARALCDDFGIAYPRLAIAGLNPHAGESGALGREEMEIIAPAAAALRHMGIDCTDPLPSDTLFHAQARAKYDAVVCMYHDQALIPVKMLDFWGGVNVTLGLPIVRTSPDHGTGHDIAGRGLARADSLISAIDMAADIARRRGSKAGSRAA